MTRSNREASLRCVSRATRTARGIGNRQSDLTHDKNGNVDARARKGLPDQLIWVATDRRIARSTPVFFVPQLVQQTDKGTFNWTAEEITFIRQNERLPRGIVGHHINNVAAFPEWQGDPRSISFVRGQPANLAAHGGNFHNSTTGRLIDREAMLRKARRTDQ